MSLNSLVVIAPVALLEQAESLASAVSPEWGTGNLTVPLSSDGTAPATHMGCRAWEYGAWGDAIAELNSGYTPEGFTAEQVQSLLGALIVDIIEDTDLAGGRGHFNEVISANGFQKVLDQG